MFGVESLENLMEGWERCDFLFCQNSERAKEQKRWPDQQFDPTKEGDKILGDSSLTELRIDLEKWLKLKVAYFYRLGEHLDWHTFLYQYLPESVEKNKLRRSKKIRDFRPIEGQRQRNICFSPWRDLTYRSNQDLFLVVEKQLLWRTRRLLEKACNLEKKGGRRKKS